LLKINVEKVEALKPVNGPNGAREEASPLERFNASPL
jgi:hypothetical protein